MKMRNFTKPRLLALASCIVLLILISGCGDSSGFIGCDGAVVECFYHKDDPDYKGHIGDFCIEKDIRPCQCFTDPKEGKQENRLPEFKNPEVDCDDGPSKGIGEEPYEMKFPNKSDLIYIEDEFRVYFDKSSMGYDRNSRPLYVSFVIPKFDLVNNDYTISLFSDGKLLDEERISNDISHESPRLRYFSGPNFCGDFTECKVTGTVKFDIRDASPTSFSGDLKLTEHDKNSAKSTLIADNYYPFKYSDIDRNSSTRSLNIVNLIYSKADNYDISTYQTLEWVPYEEAVKNVFGENKSNVYISTESKIISKEDEILHDGELIILDLQEAGTKEDVTKAIREWGKDAYAKTFPTINFDAKGTGVMGVEAYYFGLFDVSTSPPKPMYETKEEHYKALAVYDNPHGLTMAHSEYVFSLVLRIHDSEFSSSPLDERNSIALSTHLHELGHALSTKGYHYMGEGECEQHTYFCSGYNKDMCLWRTPCFDSGDKRRTYMKERAKDPTFCERHQQIFMNNFSLREEN